MKKIFLLGLVFFMTLVISGCNFFEDNPDIVDQIPIDQEPNDQTPIYNFDERIYLGASELCPDLGHGEYLIIEGVCLLIQDLVSVGISVSNNQTTVQYSNPIEQMDEFVADLSGSTGLAVIPREVFDTQDALTYENKMTLLNLSSSNDELTENLIVKLTEDGFFEEVSFKDSAGFEVNIKSNPLALEVYGVFTVVIFDVDLGYTHNRNFNQRIWDSLYAGGVYVIHNETGKVFSTKTVAFEENVQTYYESHHYTITTTANVNEPVMREVIEYLFDENNEPIFDKDGNHLHEITLVPVLDYDGNPVIFDTGPVHTTFELMPVLEYYHILVVDENGDPVLDENGEPVYEYVEEHVLDENGELLYIENEVPILDENGNVQYQEDFLVEVEIYEQITHTHTYYYAHMTEGPLFDVARRFVDRVLAEYYNWNYYRVHNYQISEWHFAIDEDDIYYMVNKDTNDDSYERVIMRVSYDSDTNEILLEEYINATKAGFENCELFIDPLTSNIICRNWDSNIKIFSRTKGLLTIPDSDQFQPIIFPNGELYFFTWQDNYVEELGYHTRLLHTITVDGDIESRYIELGERDQTCEGETCDWSFRIYFIDETGEYINNNYYYLPMNFLFGDKYIENGTLKVREIGAFESTREACQEGEECWMSVSYEIYNADTFIGEFAGSHRVYHGERTPGFFESYNINDGSTLNYRYKWSDLDKICDNEDTGCLNQFYLYDPTINLHGIWIHTRQIIEAGETFIDRFTLNETNNATYVYTKELTGIVCEYEQCEEYIPTIIYDNEGNILSHNNQHYWVQKDDIIPLYYEYRITEDTTLVEADTVCTSSQGCWRSYNTLEDKWFSIHYESGETMYQIITFAETDRKIVTEETRTSEVCTDINGCNGHEVTYLILDENDNILYEFKTYSHVEYSYRLPYTVTLTMDDVTVYTQKQSLQEIEVCESEVCYRDTSIHRIKGNDHIYIANGTITYNQGDQIIQNILLAEEQLPFEIISDNFCQNENGCILHTINFTIVNTAGEILPYNTNHNNNYPVHFEYGQLMPTNVDNLEVTFELDNIVYRRDRMNGHHIFDRIHNIKILEDNYYFIPRSSWSPGQDNFILEYNPETSQYSAYYTNLPSMHEIAKLGDGFVGINDDKTAIYYLEFNAEKSHNDYHYFDVINLTEGKQINAVNNLIVDYDGSLYFKAVDNFVQDITGTISAERIVTIDTTYTEREIIRLRPIN